MALWPYVQGPAAGSGQAPASMQAGNIQGQAGLASEQPDLVKGVPAYCRGVGLNGF